MPYVPFLKIKQGEFAALEMLAPETFQKIKPYHLFVNDTNRDRAGSYFETFSKPMSKIYGDGKNSCFVDFSQFTSVPVMSVCDYMKAESINFTYVVRDLNITVDIATELRDKGMTASGIAVSLDAQTQYNFDALNSRFRQIKQFFNIDEASIDLIIQFGYLRTDQFGYQVSAFNEIQRNVVGFDYFRNIITSSGAFPKDVTPFALNSITNVARHELGLFSALVKASNRKIIFGDHGNLHCVHDPAAGGFEGSASLKYTTKDSYRVFRGAKPSEHPRGNSQYIDKCQLLVGTNYFDGEDFSFGDNEIYKCATELNPKPGSAKTWIRNTLNHHITRVVAEFP